MKPFIIIVLIFAVLFGVILTTNHPKRTLTKNDTLNITDNINIENNEHCEGESCETEKLNKEDKHEHDEDHEHDHSVEIEGSVMKSLTIQEIANLWEINSEKLLDRIIQEFDLQENYTTETTLEYIRDTEYKFSPAIIKDIAEEMKSQNIN